MTETSTLARPQRIRLSLWDDAAGATPLELPERRMWPVALILAVTFAIFTGVEWTAISRLSVHDVRDVFDLMFVLFEAFWVLAWSVGVVTLGALTVLLFFYSESARLQDGRLVHVPRLGPLKVIIEYELARVRNVRLENAGGQNRSGSVSMTTGEAMGSATRCHGPTRSGWSTGSSTLEPPPSLTSPSGLALVAANLVPLGGVLFFGWDLASVIVLYWAESAVVGFYTTLKMAIVGKFAALFAVPFFVGHFGGFMALHFLFIYSLFVRGPNPVGAEPGVREALVGVFMPVWSSLAALFISHGISFFSNFIGRREYAGATIKGLMTAPYNRIVVMQITLILGGWIILLLKSPVPALALLVLLKTAVDFSAHRKEHR